MTARLIGPVFKKGRAGGIADRIYSPDSIQKTETDTKILQHGNRDTVSHIFKFFGSPTFKMAGNSHVDADAGEVARIPR